MSTPVNQTQQDLDQFVAITQASHEDAQHFLTSGSTLEAALENFFAAQAAGGIDTLSDEDPEDALLTDDIMSDQPEEQKQGGGPRTLDGKPAEALPEGWGQPAPKKKASQSSGGGIATLFNTGIHPGANRPERKDDDDDPQEFYAGGKSGLAVENPNRPGEGSADAQRSMVEKILKQARDHGPVEQPSASAQSAFGGAGNVLGSENDPSTDAPQPPQASGSGAGPSVTGVSTSMFDQLLSSMMGGQRPPPVEEGEPQTRQLIFWRNGFSIEDGPLLSYDDPENKKLLDDIQAGRAPPSVFDVKYNEPLTVEVAERRNEDYVKPKKTPRSFGGEGNRLGSAAPDVSSGSTTPSMPGGLGGQSAAPTSATSAPQSFELDTSKPTTSVQIRLGDGTKLVAKVNLTHTVGDLRNYVAASRPDARPFILQTTFPSKELADSGETIEQAKLQNAVVVQRFA